jgi:hypothetical protein
MYPNKNGKERKKKREQKEWEGREQAVHLII